MDAGGATYYKHSPNRAGQARSQNRPETEQDIMHPGKSATRKVATLKPIQIRGRFFTAVALHLSGRPDAGFLAGTNVYLDGGVLSRLHDPA